MKVGRYVGDGVLRIGGALGWGWMQSQHPTPVSAPEFSLIAFHLDNDDIYSAYFIHFKNFVSKSSPVL